MASYYPVYLNLKGRSCVVIGGGEVAERKVRYLLECGARVTIVAPQVTPGVEALACKGKLAWERRRYREGDLEGAFLAIAGTDDTSVNREVAQEAKRHKVLLNVVDAPALCDFIAPAVVRRGAATVAISTSGASPALARRLREEMERSDVLAWADAAEVLREARLDLRRRKVAASPNHWQECMTGEILHLVRSGQREVAKERLMHALEEAASSAEVTQ